MRYLGYFYAQKMCGLWNGMFVATIALDLAAWWFLELQEATYVMAFMPGMFAVAFGCWRLIGRSQTWTPTYLSVLCVISTSSLLFFLSAVLTGKFVGSISSEMMRLMFEIFFIASIFISALFAAYGARCLEKCSDSFSILFLAALPPPIRWSWRVFRR